MRAHLHRPGVVGCAAVAVGAVVFLGLMDRPQAHGVLEFSGLMLAAILASGLARQQSLRDSATMPPSFVIEFTSLLLLGPDATMLVAAAGVVARSFEDSQPAHRTRRMVLNAATAMVSIQAAGLVHQALGGTTGQFVWPAQGAPIAAAVIGYCLVKSVLAAVVVPFITRQPIDRAWPRTARGAYPGYFIGASIAVGLVEVIDHRMWEILPVAAVPLYLAYREYCAHLNRLEEEQRRQEVIESLDHGMSVVDDGGRVTLWNDALVRILDCPRARALNRSLVAAVPALGTTELPRAIHEALASRSPRTLAHLELSLPLGARILHVRILPVVGGATLLWHDVTERALAEHSLKRREERLALAAEGAHDGLWAWDLRSQEVYFSGRWRAMLGLPETAGLGRPEEWLDRVHVEDIGALKGALEAHLAGKTDRFQHEHRIRHEDGTYRQFLCHGVALHGPGRRPSRIAGSMTDLAGRSSAQERSDGAGFLDPLTGLCNRAVFVEGLGRRLEEFKARRSGSRFAALYLDLDRFKVVNDSLGHLVGDELLAAASRRIESCLRQGDVLARLGGDEFAILLNEIGDANQANAVSFRIQDALSAPFSIGGREVFTSASIGIAFGRATYDNPEEIMRDADAAMYHAKSRGKARHELFDADMHARALDRLGFENDLRHAVAHEAFEVHYQPIVSLASGMCVGFESLIRWTRNEKAVSPAIFIPIAEELGLIEPIGTWVMHQACSTFADWKRRFPDGGLDYITVNVSGRQLMQQNFPRIVEQAVQRSDLEPRDLRLEITETALMDNPQMAAELLRELRNFGVKIYLDDFGTGYSSLSHLHRLPVDALKIDHSFVRSLLLPERPAIVESILALARTLNTSVVAEGIETSLQARELERLGCTHAQGFLFSRPLSARAAQELLAANQPLGPKKVQPSGAVDTMESGSELYYPTTRFEWPKELQPA